VGNAGTLHRGLEQRHFALQSERPQRLSDVALGALEPTLRSLLLTDGTVARALEALALERVTVKVVTQANRPLPSAAAEPLETHTGENSVHRRVEIGTVKNPMPLIWAESHILPQRLPENFLKVLDNAPEGIGESLQQVRLESCRDLLWFGLDTPPGWSTAARAPSSEAITRCYRVTAGGRPCLLISESFAVERHAGGYRLGLS
jgi:chorismate-pyruvate lyase